MHALKKKRLRAEKKREGDEVLRFLRKRERDGESERGRSVK